MSDAVGVVFGGPSPEHDVSVVTGLQAAHALLDRGHEVVALYWTKTGDWVSIDPRSETSDLADGVPGGAKELRLALGRRGGFLRKRPLGGRGVVPLDVVVNCCHGGPGEDGTLQGAFDLAGMRYTGPSQRSAMLSMDKLAFAAFAEAQGLPRLHRVGCAAGIDWIPPFSAPYIVKPRYGGSSIGIEVVKDAESLRALVEHSVHLREGAVVEPYLPDADDLNVAIRTFPRLEVSAIEQPVRSDASRQFLSFEDKYVGREGMAGAPRELPADLPDKVVAEIKRCAEIVGRFLPVRGIVRLDFLRDGMDLYVNEVNSIPGSLAKYLWIHPPRTFHELLDDIIEEARSLPTYHPSTEGADGGLLRKAGSIAAKLTSQRAPEGSVGQCR
ncbi:MAG: D-alanine--D-alanine ligase family protein [Egibacteraceae bacterium]